jgi:Na+/H+-dicarboxylate symporter/ABC-type amino acid transport substrate-binding protein
MWRRSHPPEFKARVALEALSAPDSLEAVAARHGLPVDTVRHWRDDLRGQAPRLFKSPLRRLGGWLWPASVGQRFLVAILAGAGLGWLLPAWVPFVEPLGLLGLQASQLVVMPLLICEVLLALGRVAQGSLPNLLRLGGLWLVLLWLIGAAAVLLMPLMLPQLQGSPFFDPSLISPRPQIDLVRTMVPANLFQALAADNVAAIVLICGALGVLLHRVENRDDLLRPLAVLTRLFRDLNWIVINILPLSVLALTARSVARIDVALLIRLQGLLGIILVASLVVTCLLGGLLLALLPCSAAQLWRIVAGPLGLVLGSANVMAALPLLLANLRRELARCAWGAEEQRAQAEEEMTAAVALGFALPGLGQVMGLVCVPFLAWMRDQTLSLSDQLRLLILGLPSVTAGLKVAVREGLRQQGLPLDLLTLIDVTGALLYRLEKGMTLLGLVSLALVVYAGALHRLRFRPLPLLLALGVGGLQGWLGGSAVQAGLTTSLQRRYQNDRLVLERPAMESQPAVAMEPLPAPASVSLQAIRNRGVLRLGVRKEAMPWAYRNRSGQWVGFDLDLLRRLTKDLGIANIQLVEGDLPDLERWLTQERLDLIAGGLVVTPGRSARFLVSDPYLKAHLGLVVADAAVRRIQDLDLQPLERPLRLAVMDPDLLTPNLRDRIDQLLGRGLTSVRIAPITSRRAFFGAEGVRRFDGLLTTTEGGAAWSAVHPSTTLLAPFGSALPVRLGLLIGGSDPALSNYINSWLNNPDSQGALRDLYGYWILMQGGPGAPSPSGPMAG